MHAHYKIHSLYFPKTTNNNKLRAIYKTFIFPYVADRATDIKIGFKPTENQVCRKVSLNLGLEHVLFALLLSLQNIDHLK